jgi:hypothetical protein
MVVIDIVFPFLLIIFTYSNIQFNSYFFIAECTMVDIIRHQGQVNGHVIIRGG